MQIAFYTSQLGAHPLDEIAAWGAAAGFGSLELDVVNHIGDPARAGEAIATVRRHGLEVCAMTMFGNLLNADLDARRQVRSAVDTVVDAAIAHGVPLVCTFPGRDERVGDEENYRQLADYYGPLVERAAQGKVKMIIENWPGPHQNYLATTPAGWARLFELVPAPNLGLNFDPSHLIWQGIDIEQALRAVADRVFLVHAKDTEIFADRLQQTGYFGSGWWTYRLPGHGVINWSRWLGVVREVGFDGVISIEHEDQDWGFPHGTVEQRQDGLLEAQKVLKEALG